MIQYDQPAVSTSQPGSNKKPRDSQESRGFVISILCYRLLVQGGSYVYGASYGATYHGVVTDTEEAHHLYVGRYR